MTHFPYCGAIGGVRCDTTWTVGPKTPRLRGPGCGWQVVERGLRYRPDLEVLGTLRARSVSPVDGSEPPERREPNGWQVGGGEGWNAGRRTDNRKMRNNRLPGPSRVPPKTATIENNPPAGGRESKTRASEPLRQRVHWTALCSTDGHGRPDGSKDGRSADSLQEFDKVT